MLILWIKTLHLFFMVTWFAGLFYLPRLYVYHAEAKDEIGIARFKIMERKLYFGIATPGAVLTIIFGFWLMGFNLRGYITAGWMHAKLALVVLLLFYHIYLGHLWYAFKRDKNVHGSFFYRMINEIPVLFLFGIAALAVVKPIFKI